jgi:hypothetical protein
MTSGCFVEERTNKAHLILAPRLTHVRCLYWIIRMISKYLMVAFRGLIL